MKISLTFLAFVGLMSSGIAAYFCGVYYGVNEGLSFWCAAYSFFVGVSSLLGIIYSIIEDN